MSVLARLRSASKLDVLDLAEEIRAEATRLVWNTNVVPKGWRDVFAKPMCALCHKLHTQIRAANRIWSTTEELVEERKKKAQEAIDTLRDIDDLINYLATTLPVDWNRFDPLLNLMLKEEGKLKKWKDNTKIVKRK